MQKLQQQQWLILQRFQEQEIERRKMIQKEQETHFKRQIITNTNTNTQYQCISPSEEIYFRQVSEVKTKNKWIEQQKELQHHKRFQTEMKDVTFHPQILQQSKQLNNGRNRTPEQYYKDALKYKEEKQNQLKDLKEQLELNQKQMHPFSPHINSKSPYSIHQDFYDRLEEKQALKQFRLQQIQKNTLPSFSPKINQRSKSQKHSHKAMPINPTTPQKFQLESKQIVQDQRSFEFFEGERRKQSHSTYDKILYEEGIKKKLLLLNETIKKDKQKSSEQTSPLKQKNKFSPYKSILSKATQYQSSNDEENERKQQNQQKNYFTFNILNSKISDKQ